MANDWAANVKKYAPDADDGVIAGIVRYCGIALQKVDSSLVSYSDPVELGRVRNNFLKKKCALTDSDEVLDAAIAKVGERMKDDRTKNRVTVYYLLAEHFGLHHLFLKGGVAKPVAVAAVAPVAEAPAAIPVAAMGLAGAAALAGVGAVSGVATAAAAPLAGARYPWHGSYSDGGAGSSVLGRVLALGRGDGETRGMLGWLMWLPILLLALALIWFLFLRTPPAPTVAFEAPATTTAVPATSPAPVPEGAGVISEMRETKPLAKVYFETGKSDVSPELAPATDSFRAYLAANAGSIVGISGYNDPTGNAAANAELSKRRAQAVRDTLVEAGIPETSIELIKPEAATDATVSKEEARRVEVYIK